jgi:hypothetical protein
VYLPLMDKTEQKTSTNTIESIPTGTERILLIDDELPIAKLERQMLERLGYKVTEKISLNGSMSSNCIRKTWTYPKPTDHNQQTKCCITKDKHPFRRLIVQ